VLWFRQLPIDTLVAVVDTLRTLALLYRVNADDDDELAVEMDELRQLDETLELAMELVLDTEYRPLRLLVGEGLRSLCALFS
jgi:hypothetical protein